MQIFWYLLCQICGLVSAISFEKFSSITASNIFLCSFSLSFPSATSTYKCIILCNGHIVLVWFFFHFFIYMSVWKVSMDRHIVQQIDSLFICAHSTDKTIKGIFCYCYNNFLCLAFIFDSSFCFR